MNLLLILFVVFGSFSLLCILIFTVFYSDIYFSSAFAAKPPKLTGPNAASTNAVISYWVTKVFLVCASGFLLIYLFNMARN